MVNRQPVDANYVELWSTMNQIGNEPQYSFYCAAKILALFK